MRKENIPASPSPGHPQVIQRGPKSSSSEHSLKAAVYHCACPAKEVSGSCMVAMWRQESTFVTFLMVVTKYLAEES